MERHTLRREVAPVTSHREIESKECCAQEISAAVATRGVRSAPSGVGRQVSGGSDDGRDGR